MKRFCIITNTDKGENAQMVQHIVHFLEEKDCLWSLSDSQLKRLGRLHTAQEAFTII